MSCFWCVGYIVSGCQTTLEGKDDRSDGLGFGGCTVRFPAVGAVVCGTKPMTATHILIGFIVAHVVAQGFVWWFANV